MCRESLPVWQSFSDEYPQVRVIGVGLGADLDRIQAYVNEAEVCFTTLADQHGKLAASFGFRSVRNVLLYDEEGSLEFVQAGGFDLRDQSCLELVRRWAQRDTLEDLQGRVVTEGKESPEVKDLFARGVEEFRQGDVKEALDSWRAALAISPGNVILRDQLWSIESPSRFYRGDVDEDWKQSQIERR